MNFSFAFLFIPAIKMTIQICTPYQSSSKQWTTYIIYHLALAATTFCFSSPGHDLNQQAEATSASALAADGLCWWPGDLNQPASETAVGAGHSNCLFKEGRRGGRARIEEAWLLDDLGDTKCLSSCLRQHPPLFPLPLGESFQPQWTEWQWWLLPCVRPLYFLFAQFHLVQW